MLVKTQHFKQRQNKRSVKDEDIDFILTYGDVEENSGRFSLSNITRVGLVEELKEKVRLSNYEFMKLKKELVSLTKKVDRTKGLTVIVDNKTNLLVTAYKN